MRLVQNSDDKVYIVNFLRSIDTRRRSGRSMERLESRVL
jgi:hypothetical protein